MSMKEKYESILLTDLRAMARNRGVKNVTDYKKDEIVQIMLELDKKDELEKANTVLINEKNKSVEISNNNDKISLDNKKKIEKKSNKNSSKAMSENQNTSKQINDKTENKTSNTSKQINDKTENKVNNTSKTVKVKAEDKVNISSDNSENEVARLTEDELREKAKNATLKDYPKELDSGIECGGILEVMQEGFGFIRCENFLPGENDVYVSNSQIRRFNLRTGDIIKGHLKIKTNDKEKFSALLYLSKINGLDPDIAKNRFQFENMTPIFPNERIKLEIPGAPVSMRIMDLLCPVGKGQRGMIVSPPKAGKTTLLKSVAKSIKASNPDMHMLILLIDERPEEVTDIKEEVMGKNVEVIYSTFDETPEHHKRVSEMVIERARRLVEYKKDVIILLDSITRLTRAYNQVVPPSGRTLSGGLDPAALHMPKRFFGAARNMREGGSLTILATALIETGSKMDDVVYEEFKGTGNMEMVLDRKLSERRVFPAIDIPKSGTRRDDLLLSADELEAVNKIRRNFNDSVRGDDAVNWVLDNFAKTKNNKDFVATVCKMH